MSRLETVERDLARELASADPGALRLAAAELAEYAIAQTGLQATAVDGALRQLRGEANDDQERWELARLVEELDERQWETPRAR
jgi:hypothetical protein